MKKIIYLLILITLSPVIAFADNQIDLPRDANGWTIFTPSDDSRIIYVSAAGDDNCSYYDDDDAAIGSDPFQPAGAIVPCATYAKALTYAREGYPDWILFKRGDTFTISSTYAIVPTSGRSAMEPSLTGAYGLSGASPVIKVTETNQQAVRIHRTSPNWIAISGIDFYSYTRNPLDPGYSAEAYAITQAGYATNGAPITNTYRGFLLEGCKFRFFDVNISINSTGAPIDGLTIRRNISTDAYTRPGQAHSQGLYMYNQNPIVEENILIHNGWYSPDGIGSASVFTHNIYFSCPLGATYIGNTLIQGSNMNAKFTADSFQENEASNPIPIVVENNLFIDGQQGVGFGNNTVGNTYPFLHVTVRDNVFTDIGKSNHNQGIAWGVDTGYDSTGTTVTNNLLLNQTNADVQDVIAFMTAGIQSDLNISGNTVYNWKYATAFRARDAGDQRSTGSTKTNVSFTGNTISNPENAWYFIKADTAISGTSFAGNIYHSDRAASSLFAIGATDYSMAGWQAASGDDSILQQPTFPETTRSIETYMASLDETATIDAFIAKSRAQDRYNWDTRFTAEAVNDYLRAGFGMSEYTPPGQARRLSLAGRPIKLAEPGP